jgi:hypothetical protein
MLALVSSSSDSAIGLIQIGDVMVQAVHHRHVQRDDVDAGAERGPLRRIAARRRCRRGLLRRGGCRRWRRDRRRNAGLLRRRSDRCRRHDHHERDQYTFHDYAPAF